MISSCHMFLAILGPLPVVSYSYSGECWIKLLTEKTIQVNSVIIDEINGKFFIWSWAHAVVKHRETCCFKSRHPDLSCTDNKLKLTDNFNFNMFCITKGAHCALHNMYTCMCPAVGCQLLTSNRCFPFGTGCSLLLLFLILLLNPNHTALYLEWLQFNVYYWSWKILLPNWFNFVTALHLLQSIGDWPGDSDDSGMW